MSRRRCSQVDDLKKHFPVRGGLFSRTVGEVHAVDGVASASSAARRWLSSANPAAASPRSAEPILRLIDPPPARWCSMASASTICSPGAAR